MGKTKFTAGKWKISKSPFEVVNLDHKNYLPYEVKSGHQIIAAFYELDADTHLMSQSKAMYELLDSIAELVNLDDQSIADEMIIKFDEIELLLAKSRGEHETN